MLQMKSIKAINKSGSDWTAGEAGNWHFHNPFSFFSQNE